MSKNKFQVGDLVAVYKYKPLNHWDDREEFIEPRYDEYDEQVCFGEVKALPTKENGKCYTIAWDNRGEYADVPYSDQVLEKYLVAEKELPKLQKTLEKEFNATSKLVKAKMNEASKLIREATKMANAINFELIEMDFGNLYSSMNEGGWRTSSFNCQSL